jgi:hypothetical protein
MQNKVFISIKTRGTCTSIKHRSLKLEAKAGKWVWVELIHVRVQLRLLTLAAFPCNCIQYLKVLLL